MNKTIDLSLALALALVFTFFNLAMAAPSLEIGDVTGLPGGTVQLPISLTNQAGVGISALSTDIIIDDDIFSNVTIDIGPAGEDAKKTIFDDFNDTDTCRIGIISLSNNTVIEDGVVAYLTLTIGSLVSNQTINIVHNGSGSNSYGESVSVNAIQGSVTIDSTSGSQADINSPDFYLTLLDNTNRILQSGSVTHVYGSQGENKITLQSGALAKLFNFPGSNSIIIEASTGQFAISRSGATVTFQGTDGTLLVMPATTTPQSIIFNDKRLNLKIYSGKVLLGDQTIN
ncbi:MAG: hypothetical protein GY737_14310 [Desulfobacteraceae bacterium]|nr:hypothetical protein [Desulfobacteraceae bacterium]